MMMMVVRSMTVFAEFVAHPSRRRRVGEGALRGTY